MPRLPLPMLFGVLIMSALAGCGPAGGASLQATGSAVPASPSGTSAPASPPGTPSPPPPSSPTPAPTVALQPALPGRIAFGRFDDALGDFQVFTMHTDGSDARLLVSGAHEGPRWSPDQTMISMTDFTDGHFLKILRPDGTLVRDLKAPDATIGLGCDHWSPDGTRFLCEGWDDTHPDRIGMYSVRASDGGDLVRLTSPADRQHDIPGGWSLDGTRIAYVHVTDEQREVGQLWIMNADGSDAHRASETTIGYHVEWSPDSRSILADGGGSLLAFDAADQSKAPVPIAIPNTIAFGGSWSPDGSHLAFSVLTPGRNMPDIATVAADGTDFRVLTSDPAKEEFPAWGLPTP